MGVVLTVAIIVIIVVLGISMMGCTVVLRVVVVLGLASGLVMMVLGIKVLVMHGLFVVGIVDAVDLVVAVLGLVLRVLAVH